jgi:two-component sensor histidine kinase/putative methionine-R-sulfoxide reductase with GAF domain
VLSVWGIRITIPLLALVCYAALLWITAKQGFKKAVNRFFALYLLSILVWSFGAVMMYVDAQNALLWNKVMLSGLMGMPVAFFGFVRAFLAAKGQAWWLYLGYASYIVLLLLDAQGYMTEYVYFTEEGLIRYQFGPAAPLLGASFMFLIGFSALNLSQGYRQTTNSLERNRIKYALFGISAIVLGIATDAVPALGAYPIDIAANVVNAFLIAYAIFRYQLLDITLVIRRGLAYGVTVVSIVAGYLLTFFALDALLHVSGQGVILAVFAGAVIIVLAFPPLRERAQLWIDRLFFREKYDSRQMLQELSQTATSLLGFDELTTTILDRVATTMGIGKIGLLLEDGKTGEFQVAVQRGMPEDATRVTLRQDHPLVHYLSQERLLTQHDIEILPQFQALWTQEREDLAKLGAEFFIPLRAKDKLVGMFAGGPKLSGETYSPDDQITLVTLANQTAVAIENARLYEETRRRLVREERLNELAHALGGEMELATLIPRLLPLVAELTGADAGNVAIFDPDRNIITYPYHYNLPDALAGLEMPAGSGLAWQIIQIRRPMLLDDYREHPAALRPWVEAGVRSLLGVPLLIGDQVVGALGLFSLGQVRPFGPEAVAAAEAAGRLAAVAIQRARLFEQERTRATQLALISEVGKNVAILDLGKLLQEVACSIQESFNYYNVALFLVDEERREVVMQAVAGGFEPVVLGKYRQSLDEGILSFVAKTGSSWLANDVSKDPYYIKGFLAEPLTKSELCVPIRLGDKVIGVLDMQSIYLNAFGQEDVVTVEVLADRIAIAIENARLYAAAQQELAERKRAEEQTKAALAEKEMLLREVHHRVKNNLQAIISLISMQAEQIGDARTTQSLKELQERAYAMALVYEQLYQAENLAQIPMKPYLQDLSVHVFQAFGGGRAIKLSVEAAPVSLDVETALPCGLIVNELVTNALKYSFPGDSKDGAEVRVEFQAEDATYTLVVSDNGVGLPPGLDWRKARTMGLRLVSFWATHQLGGKLEVDNRQGTAFQITFGEQPKRQRPG